MFPLAFVAESLQGHWWGFISWYYVVWPIFFLMNVFIALKGTHFWILLYWWEFLPGLCVKLGTYQGWTPCQIGFPKVGVGPDLSGGGLSLQGGLKSGIPQCCLRTGGLGTVQYVSGRSLMYSRNKIGPRTEPCYTSGDTGTSSERSLSRRTLWLFPTKKDWIQWSVLPCMPCSCSLYMGDSDGWPCQRPY